MNWNAQIERTQYGGEIDDIDTRQAPKNSSVD